MNDKIKEILKKHIPIDFLLHEDYHEDLNNAIIEICEEQKMECAQEVQWEATPIRNAKNIAQ